MLRNKLTLTLSLSLIAAACGPDAPDTAAGFGALTPVTDPWGATRTIDPKDSVNTGNLPEGCIKIEGSDLGVDATLSFGSNEVELSNWHTKSDSPGEFFKFYFDLLDAPAYVAVKAGKDVYEAWITTDAKWYWNLGGWTGMGPNVKGISNVVFCDYDPTGLVCPVDAKVSDGDVCACPTDTKSIDPCL